MPFVSILHSLSTPRIEESVLPVFMDRFMLHFSGTEVTPHYAGHKFRRLHFQPTNKLPSLVRKINHSEMSCIAQTFCKSMIWMVCLNPLNNVPWKEPRSHFMASTARIQKSPAGGSRSLLPLTPTSLLSGAGTGVPVPVVGHLQAWCLRFVFV